MKKLIFFMILLSSFLAFPKPSEAKVMIQEKGIVAIPSNQVIDDDLFVGAESFDLSGTVNGSVFAGAGMGDIKGTVKGDLVLGIGNASISGFIAGDLYVGGGDITLTNATIGGNIIAGTGNLMIDSGSKIGGSLIAGSGNIKNSASIGRNAMLAAGSIYVDSKVGKEARLAASNIELGPNTSIAGDLTYALGENGSTISQDPGAVIVGTLSRYTPPADARRDMEKAREDFSKFGRMASKGFLVVSFLGTLILGFVILKLMPNTALAMSGTLSRNLAMTLGIGFLIVVAIVPIFLVLALTVIGLPLVGVLFLLFTLGLHLSKLIASYALGMFIVKQFNLKKIGLYGVFAMGLAIFYLLRSVPGIGWITSILFTWSGLGAIWLYTKDNLKSL